MPNDPIVIDAEKVNGQFIVLRDYINKLEEKHKAELKPWKADLEVLKGKQKVTVKFQAANGSEIGAVFGIRMIRADAK